MKDIINSTTVLQLNRAWMACGTKTVADAIGMVFTGAAKALDVENSQPLTWTEWIRLPIREQDDVIHSPNMSIRAPRVIIAINYDKMPKTKPRPTNANLRRRYNGKCAITGKVLKPSEGSKEHVIPRSKGGRSDWSNMIYADKKINSQRGNKSYKEAGLPEPKILPPPAEIPVSMSIRNDHNIPEWDLYLIKQDA